MQGCNVWNNNHVFQSMEHGRRKEYQVLGTTGKKGEIWRPSHE